MNMLKKFLLSLGVVAAAEIPLKGAEPDFSHPRDVLGAAYATLAATEGDADAGPQRVRALLEICVASESIDPDSIFHMIDVASELAAKEQCGSARSLMQLVEANLISDAYARRRWVYDRLETPAEPLPKSVADWNGAQFRAQIKARALNALSVAAAHDAPLADYADAVSADTRTLIYFPTVADFVAQEVVRLLRRVDADSDIKDVVAGRIKASRDGSAPYYYWSLEQLTQPSKPTAATLYDFYMQHRDDEFARMALLSLADRVSDGNVEIEKEDGDDSAPAEAPHPSEADVIALLEESLERFPGYWDNNSLRNALARLRQGHATVVNPTVVCPGQPFEVELRAEYASKAGFRVYRVTDAMLGSRLFSAAGRKAIASFDFEGQGQAGVPLDIKQQVTVDAPGLYFVLPWLDGKLGKDSPTRYDVMVCTPYIPLAFTGTTEQVVAMADYVTGRPVPGVRVLTARGKSAAVPVGTTDKDGLARFRLSGKNGNYYTLSAVTPSGEKLSFAGRVSLHSPWAGRDRTERVFNVELLAGRPIYHPGDTLRWLSIADFSDDSMKSRHAAASLKIEVELLDANRSHVASVHAVTDIYGRADGVFVLPEEGLTGNYTLQAKVDDTVEGSRAVMVSDYRMPTFEVTDVEVVRDAPAAGDVSIRGLARTYSGMPVADAQVSAAISEAYRMRFMYDARSLGTVDGRTGADGWFALVVPAAMLAEGNDFSARITVTSPSAEAAEAMAYFTDGKPYDINITGNGYIKALTETRLPVTVSDASGRTPDVELCWQLIEKGTDKVAASGACNARNPIADLDRVHGGYYRLKVETADAALADATQSGHYFTLYNVALNSMPSDMPLLVDCHSTTTNSAGRASVQYGVGMSDTWLYATLCVGDRIVETEVSRRGKGFRHLSLDLPADASNGVLKLGTVRDGKLYTYSIDVNRPQQSALKIEGESFRDRLVPGASEHWTLRVSRADGKPVEAAVAATMYNHSLDALAGLSWPSEFSLDLPWPQLQLGTLRPGSNSGTINAALKLLDAPGLQAPTFRYWPGGTGYYLSGAVNGIAARSLKMNKMMASADGAVVEEEVALDEVVTTAGAAAGAIDAPAEEEGAVAPVQPESFDYRDADVAEAFWKPVLATDADGRVTLDFTVPDANTTWRLQALAWTADMNAGQLVRDIVANKPVMVQPNLPRFLRVGDKASIVATAYNNTDTATTIRTVVETFDAVTMQRLSVAENESSVQPGASFETAIEIVAPEAMAIGYRVRSSNGTFADGEQTLVPVESAQCDVVESTPFYLNPGDRELKLRIPSVRDGSYTLQYCQNPSWTIVKALPGLVTYKPSTTPAAVDALFAACTARGIVERNPEVAKAIAAWSRDSLTSRLAQNDALKIAALNATPWVQAAESESARMARLALLLDGKRVRADIDNAIKVLRSLAAADGGLRWGKWSDESSVWATETALHDLGLLRLAGYLPDNAALQAMMKKALAYIDKQLEKESVGRRAEPDMAYAVVRSMWKDMAPSAYGQKVLDATLQHCIKTWRTSSTSAKANMAILLDIYGYSSVARQIMESVSQFAVATPSQGVSFPSVSYIGQYAPILMAYGRVDPSASVVDGVRQWLVVREQATSALGAADATQLIGSFLCSGTPWHTDHAPASVTLDGRAVEGIGEAGRYGGEATVALGADAAGRTLRVQPGASVPSYGAVISSYRARPQDVKAASCDAVSIEKRIVEVAPDGSMQYADEVSLGRRVRVVLTLKVERDMQYVTITDERAAALEPVEQTPGYVTSGGARFYRENRDAATNMFISYLPKGTYHLSYDCTANNVGAFAAGLATVQSALSPALTAHSAGAMLVVRR